MVFSDLIFIYAFLPLCLILYYLMPQIIWKNGILIIFSLLFYSFGEPVWVLLLIGSALLDYCNGLFIEKFRNKKIAVLGVISSLVINLGVLCIFKYSGFFVSNINSVFGITLPVPHYDLPIGISFYTFQTISYTVDVYRNKAKVQHNFLSFMLYVSLFFQLVAGPIVRYTDVANEIDNRRFDINDMSDGIRRFILGLGKKVIIANSVGAIADELLGFTDMPSSVLAVWTGVISYSLQIYFDFSGYSDMAIGLGEMFGFHFMENFNYPYVSKTATEFWRRWHISLGSFFRDYIYIPMGGNRRHQLLNLAVVWFLTGLWHGASWNYILWGVYFGFIICLEKFVFGKFLEKIPSFFSHLYLIIIVIFGWTLFYFEDFDMLGKSITSMFGGGQIPLTDDITVSLILGNIFVLIAAIILSSGIYKFIYDKLEEKGNGSVIVFVSTHIIEFIILFMILIVSSLLLVKQTYNPFLYFRY